MDSTFPAPISRRFAQATYDFKTDEIGDVSFGVGDIIEVTGRINDEWYYGSVNDGKRGSFPINFVKFLSVPEPAPGQRLFVATEHFPKQEAGDLGFKKGEVILGLQPIDDNWWKGQIGNREGIFPLSLVRAVALRADDENVRENDRTTNHIATPSEAAAAGDRRVVEAIANMDLTAQLDDELSFRKNDVVRIVGTVDEDFFVGECDNGDSGIFPLAFVDVVDRRLFDEVFAPENRPRRSSTLTSYGKTASYKEIGDEEEIDSADYLPNLNNNNYKRGSEPAEYDRHDDRNRAVSFNQENTRSHDAVVESYGRTLYAFTAQNDDELSFGENEIVKLISHVDSQWTTAEIDSRRGIVPTSYVNIIVDCPYAGAENGRPYDEESVRRTSESRNPENEYESVYPNDVQRESVNRDDFRRQTGIENKNESANQNDLPHGGDDSESESVEVVVENCYGLVRYDFRTDCVGDLSLKEDDIVRIVRQIDANWYEAKDAFGNTGSCPVDFVRIIRKNDALKSERTALPSIRTHEETPVVANMAAALPLDDETNAEIERHTSASRGTALSPVSSPSSSRGSSPKPPLPPKPQLSTTKQSTASRGRSLSPKASPYSSTESLTNVDKRLVNTNAIPVSDTTGSSTVDVPAPSRPADIISSHRTNRPKRPPLIHDKRHIVNSSLDEIVAGEMSRAKQEARLRASSVDEGDRQSDSKRIVAPPIPPLPHRSLITGDNPWAVKTDDDSYASEFGDLFQTGVSNTSWYVQPPGARKPMPPKRPARPHPVLRPVSVDSGKRPVPQRPAPVPARKEQPLVPVVLSDDELMNVSVSVTSEEENAEVAQDVQNRISVIRNDLESCIQSKQETVLKLCRVKNEDEEREVREIIEFYDANIKGLTEELDSLTETAKQFESCAGGVTSDNVAAGGGDVDDGIKLLEQQQREQENAKRRLEEMRTKMHDKRIQVLRELVDTEKDYLKDLHLICETFLSASANKCSAVDTDVLFGNIEDVVDVSEKLLTLIEGAMYGKSFEKQVVGPCFIEMADDMTKVYAQYCRNHDDVLTLLEKYEDNPEIQNYIQDGIKLIKQHTGVFDLGSLLIKPVQRILKYPLLINELVKNTEDTHPDKPELLQAINAMTDVATAINEYKRRKDLVYKYRKDADSSLSDKISKLNIHSIKKKGVRMGARLSTNLGLGSSQTVDEEFNQEEEKFKGLDKAIKLFLRGLATYMEQVKDWSHAAEVCSANIEDFYADEGRQQEVKQYQDAMNAIATTLYRQFNDETDDQVSGPLLKLIAMFHGPHKLIKKRYDKLLDYIGSTSAERRAKDPDQLRQAKENLELTKRNYEALNAQLKDELPLLFEMSVSLFKDCISNFITAQKNMINGLLRELYGLMGLPLLIKLGDANVSENFNIKFTESIDRLSDLTFIPKNFNPKMELKDKKTSRKSITSVDYTASAKSTPDTSETPQQSDSQKVYVRQKYPADKLYTAVFEHAPSQILDIGLHAGDVVGLVKDQDPMGSKERWFVDNGAMKGFAPKGILLPLNPSPKVHRNSCQSDPGGDLLDLLETPPSYEETMAATVAAATAVSNPSPHSYQSVAGHSNPAFTYPSTITSQSSQQQQQPQLEVYRAMYSFTGHSAQELSFQEGQLVNVIMKHDLEGNTEWWKVSDHTGKYGYVPGNYLTPYHS
ncbi:dynamin-binding protein-like isoform X2 [Tubulanus polymorphus]|uniref:dynamin-binding protein-like isoform X2 n=1 Tax=Tubulanus polymorphus TaxID=672921 RepID=UPI003DA30565